MQYLFGFLGLILVAAFHDLALLGISRVVRDTSYSSYWRTLAIFSLLVITHLIEITLFALYLLVLSQTLWPESLPTDIAMSWEDWIFLSGINFSTLGHSELHLTGPIRIVYMMQSLAGFMLITWSATFLYSACERYWKRESNG